MHPHAHRTSVAQSPLSTKCTRPHPAPLAPQMRRLETESDEAKAAAEAELAAQTDLAAAQQAQRDLAASEACVHEGARIRKAPTFAWGFAAAVSRITPLRAP